MLLPVTAAGQREVGERLSLTTQVARDPDLLQALVPREEAMWGLAQLSLFGGLPALPSPGRSGL